MRGKLMQNTVLYSGKSCPMLILCLYFEVQFKIAHCIRTYRVSARCFVFLVSFISTVLL